MLITLLNRSLILLLTILLFAGFAQGQSQYPFRKIYSLEKADGTVYIVAENHGSMPFTAIIRAELTNMSSSAALPVRLAVLPSERTFVLATFKPTGAGAPAWRYTSRCLDGIYTGHLPDTSYVYRLPYRLPADTIAPSRVRVTNASNYFLYALELPEQTPICAARAGTIVDVKQQGKNFRVTNKNLIYVQHDDGSYCSYENISQNSAVGQAGRQVAPGDVIGYFGGNKRNPVFWFSVFYPGDSLTMTVPVKFKVGKRIIRPREGAVYAHTQ
jgi:murein DD-endopeptidase MepM/ murein hydrolase activator NlpD